MTHVMLIGAGGNIGSHLVPHLARLPGIARLTLVDRDRYEARNLENQDVPARSVGRPKARVQAARARRVNPSLKVVAHACDVEALPLGAFRADLVVTGLDGRRARQRVNYAVRGLGVPWLDGGVLGTGTLARVTRISPAPDSPCLECRWDEADYAALEQSYPCDHSSLSPFAPPRTGAPSGLGALAAALLALECRKLLRGDPDGLAPGAELVVDAAHHRWLVTGARRFEGCRLPEHAPWHIEPLAFSLREPLESLLGLLARKTGANGDLAVGVEGSRIARRLTCERCGAARDALRVASRLRPADRRCARCGGRAAPAGFGLHEWVTPASLTRDQLRSPAGRFGLAPGEVILAGGTGGFTRFELVSPAGNGPQ